MNILKKALFSLVCVSAFASSAASAFVVTDTIIKNPDQLVLPILGYSYTHNITDDGYTPGVNRLLSAVLKIRLTDILLDESYVVTLGSGQSESGSHIQDFTFNQPTGGATVTFTLNTASLADLAADGKIDVSLRTSGFFSSSYFLADSTLTAQVPEPLTIALLGIGLLGIGAAQRKSGKKNAA
jgi:hypothetical protein